VRLENVASGHGLFTKLLLKVMPWMMGFEVPDFVRTRMYRPDFFGRHIGKYFQATLRGDSEWSVGERELFAAYTSRVNQCVF
jgi:hypothetical protein